jgi:hypothetical protein
MVAYTRKVVEKLLAQGRLVLTNAAGIPEILGLLEPYDGAVKLQEGQALFDAFEASHEAQLHLYALQKEATAAFDAAWQAARKVYGRHVKIARALLTERPELLARLGLEGARTRAYSGWLVQARQFYREALADAALLALLQAGGLAQPVLEEGLAAVEATVQAEAAQKSAKGLAQQASQDRDAAAMAFHQWLRLFWKIADVALADQPQWLERLGRVVRS